MRLICGLYRFDGVAVAPEALSAMARGMISPSLQPAIRSWRDGGVGLAVIDFASNSGSGTLERQPGGILAADRRLDAPSELAALLDRPEEADEDRLVAAAVSRWGKDAPDHLLGDFAFAHWDPGTGRLFCARDVFGVRPLHYLWRPGELFAFASFPSALHGAGLVPRALDRMAVARHLLQRQGSTESLFTGIARLPAAHSLEVSAAGLVIRRYWIPDLIAEISPAPTPEAAAATMRERLTTAVTCRLPASGDAGAHLSGGLDSSAISVLAARELRARGSRLHAWSFLDVRRNDVLLEDETNYVQAVLDQEPDIAWSAVRPPRDDVDPGPYHSDLPLPLGPGNPDITVCTEAAMAGIDIILSGWGGDEGATFNGRGTLAEHLIRGRWHMLARELSAVGRRRGISFWATVRAELLGYLLPTSLQAMHSQKRGSGLTEQLMKGLSPDVGAALRTDGEGRIELRADARRNRAALIGSAHIAQRCEHWAALGAQHGIAFAFPMLDRRVVEWALSLPSGLFQRDGWKRRLFRDAMRGVLPDRIRERHDKATPYPSMPLVLSEQRAELASRIDAAADDPTARALFDLDGLREQIDALPDAEALRSGLGGNATPAAAISALRHSLRLLAFTVQRR